MKYLLSLLLLSFISLNALANKESFGSWSYECNKGACTANQLLVAQKGGKGGVVGGLTLMALPNKQTLLTVRVSPKADPQNGVAIKVDQNKAIRVALKRCTKELCEANIIADKVLLEEMDKGKIMGVFYINASNQKQISLPFSLSGYSQAFQRLSVK